jgi:phage terminase large subunit-like protein
MTAWDACQTTIDRAAFRGKRCYVGMDLSATTDLTALVAVFPDGDHFDVLVECFVPAAQLEARARRDHAPYEGWVRDGYLQATPAPTVDYEAVRRTLLDWTTRYAVQMIAYDPWNATDLVSRLEQQDGLTCVAIRQTFAGLSAPTKSLEKAILGKELRHDGHPVLRWCISNVAVDSDPSGNLKPSKTASTEKIDAVVALILAIDLRDRHARSKLPEYAMQVFG